MTAAARELGIAPSTLLRWLNDGFIAGEQLTPGAPWRIRLTDDIRDMLVDDAPDGWVAMLVRHPRPRRLPPDRVADVSSAANSAPSSSAPDAGKACVSSSPPPKTACSNQAQSAKEQCDHASKQSEMSPSINQVVPVQVFVTSAVRYDIRALSGTRATGQRTRLVVRLQQQAHHFADEFIRP